MDCLASKKALDHKPKLSNELMMGLWICLWTLSDQCMVYFDSTRLSKISSIDKQLKASKHLVQITSHMGIIKIQFTQASTHYTSFCKLMKVGGLTVHRGGLRRITQS